MNQRNNYKLQQILQKFDPKEEDISLFLIIFERQAKRAEINKADWVTQLLPLLPPDIRLRVADSLTALGRCKAFVMSAA